MLEIWIIEVVWYVNSQKNQIRFKQRALFVFGMFMNHRDHKSKSSLWFIYAIYVYYVFFPEIIGAETTKGDSYY